MAEGRISEAALARALEIQALRPRGERLGGILLQCGFLVEADLLDALERLHRCPAVGWATLSGAAREAVTLLTPAQAVRLEAMPYQVDKRSARVAFLNPSNLTATDEVAAILGRRVLPAATTQLRLLQAHHRFYGRALSRQLWTAIQKLERGVAERLRAAPPSTAQEAESSPNASAVVLLDPSALLELPSFPDLVASGNGAPVAGADAVEPDTATMIPIDSPAASGTGELDPFSDELPLPTFFQRALADLRRTGELDLESALASLAAESPKAPAAKKEELVPVGEDDERDATAPSLRKKR